MPDRDAKAVERGDQRRGLIPERCSNIVADSCPRYSHVQPIVTGFRQNGQENMSPRNNGYDAISPIGQLYVSMNAPSGLCADSGH